jgi:hypothetical protein
MSKDEVVKMAVSDFNMQKLNTKELEEHVKSSIQIGSKIAIFGRRGTGKTEIAKQQIKDAGLKEAYINLSVLERIDLGGYPNMFTANKEKKFVDFLLPSFYEPMLEGDEGVVALLDEVDKADQSLWAPLLEFVQFGSINGRVMKNLKGVIMTGNLISEGGARPSLPLLDRAEKFLVEASAEEWLKWAGRSRLIHPSIAAFIHDNPTELFGAVDPEDRYADPSPRGWTRGSEILFKGEKLGWNPDLLNVKVAGCIGKEAGLKYQIYYKHYQELLPLIDKLFKGINILKEYNLMDPGKQLITCMITCARLANQLDTHTNHPDLIKHIGKFLQGAPKEHVLVAVRSQIMVQRIIKYNLDDHPEWEPIMIEINKDFDAAA